MTLASADLATWLALRREQVEAALRAYAPPAGPVPAVLADAMRYSLLAGGKRLRPVLALAAAEAAAGASSTAPETAVDLALPAACAIEFIHTYSLVHDDLPAMDNDTIRRGRPTAHVVFGEGQAILSGDGLLTQAFAIMSRDPSSSPVVDDGELARRKLDALALVAEAAGPAGMVGGQALDLQAAAPAAAPLDALGLRAMHARKTGALITGAARAGAVMAGAPPRALEAIAAYASHLGLAFQIVDDVLDVEGASSDLGKTAGKDAAAGKTTYPSLYGLDASKQLAAESVDRALAALADEGLSGQLPAIARWVLARNH